MTETVAVTESDCAPDCAPDDRNEVVGEGHASVRAPAREAHPTTAQSPQHSAITLRDWAQGLVAHMTPPDLWSTDRPALRKIWAHAAHGEWTTRTGLPRAAGCAHAFAVAVPVTAGCYMVAWVVERPSRHAAVWVLLILLAQFPPLSWLT